MDKQTKGRLGEDAAAEELVRRGHRIIERNYRKPCGEIDIISEINGFIVFTEVKTRKQHGIGAGGSQPSQKVKDSPHGGLLP